MRSAPVLFFAILACLLACSSDAPAQAQDRFALVIGANEYRELEPLKKARADAEAIGAALGTIGFRVELLLDPDRRGFNRAISDLLRRVTPGAIVYVHFSGHGVEIDNETYLLPVDLPLPRAGDKEFVKREAVRLSELIESLKGVPAQSRILSVDACRDNPFAEKGTRSIGGGRGLSPVAAPKGTLILYSAAGGQTALDRLGLDDPEPTSVYTRVLLRHLTTPGQSMVDVAQTVRSQVEALAASIGHDQRPAYYDELNGRLFLAGQPDPARLAGAAAPSPAPPPSRPQPKAEDRADREVWEDIKSTTSRPVLLSFLDLFPRSPYAVSARARLAVLDAPPPPVAAPAPRLPEPRTARLQPEPEAPRAPDRVPSPLPGGGWLVILGSYLPAERGKANERLELVQGAGLPARLVPTGQYGNLRPGLLAVVVGPVSRAAAEAQLGRARSRALPAYIKQAH